MSSAQEQVVSGRELWRQALKDFGGKEVQNGYTLTYVWMANQLGHFTLGFLLSFLLVWLVQLLLPSGCCSLSPFSASPRDVQLSGTLCAWAIAIAAVQALGWVAKEIHDYRVARNGTLRNIFDFNGWDVFRDAATAVAFIGFGIAVAFSALLSWRLALWVFAGGLVLALIPARYWLQRKYCFQRGKLPFLFRLSDFEGRFRKPEQERSIDDLLAAPPNAHRHLLIFGETGTGRTGLAVGILTEHLFKVRRARYMTWAKFIETATYRPDTQEAEQAWPWQDSDIVVLDDVVKMVGASVLDQPGQIAEQLGKLDEEHRDTTTRLGRRSTVWVLGAASEEAKDEWVQALAGALGVRQTDFMRAELVHPERKPPRRRYMAAFLGH